MTESEMAVLTSQLQGIMDSSDYISLCHILKLPRLEKIHKSRLNMVLCIYHKTQNCMIDKYQEITYIPINFEKVITGTLVIDEKDKLQWIEKMLSKWITWAENASTLYQKLAIEDTENKKWWSYMYKLHRSDQKEANFFHKKFVPENYEPPDNTQTVRQKLQAKMKQTSETE